MSESFVFFGVKIRNIWLHTIHIKLLWQLHSQESGFNVILFNIESQLFLVIKTTMTSRLEGNLELHWSSWWTFRFLYKTEVAKVISWTPNATQCFLFRQRNRWQVLSKKNPFKQSINALSRNSSKIILDLK